MKVAKRLSKKFKFSYHEAEDIQQEACIIGLRVLDSYDGSRPLENYLAVSIRNRLINFKRDNAGDYSAPKKVCSTCEAEGELCTVCHRRLLNSAARQHIMNPIDIDNVDSDGEPNFFDFNDAPSIFILHELQTLLDEHLPAKYREDYVKYLHGAKLPYGRKVALLQAIQEVINEKG